MSEEVKNQLTASWVWLPSWVDSEVAEDASPLASGHQSAGRLVSFYRSLDVSATRNAVIHLTADTRYKLRINGTRVALGPARSDPKMWFYDTLDIAPFLREGRNEIHVEVMRWFKSTRSGMPFVRSPSPGFTLVGKVGDEDIGTLAPGWTAAVRDDVKFPMGTGLGMDVFMHISEQVFSASPPKPVSPTPYNIKTLNGELAPWHLTPRQIPLPETSPVGLKAIHKLKSGVSESQWLSGFRDTPLVIPAGKHYLELEFDVHSTAFIKFKFSASTPSRISMKIMYSEGYEDEPIELPFRRKKSDRTNPNGLLLGPEDHLNLQIDGEVEYEPFWFRTFRLIGLDITVEGEVTLAGFEATQTNYPMGHKSSWKEPTNPYAAQMWDISIRTLRNCMYDGYSDCPFYEQLMYSGDTRSVGLFHYFVSGDDRLMRHAINLFANSYTVLPGGGLTQSRYPSHVPQIIAGFPLYFIMMINDHYTYFADPAIVKPLLPLVDGILSWFDAHIDELGLVSGMEEDVWQYVDWVDTWAATDTHPDKGVPSAGRKTNRHTFFSMIYAYTLGIAADLLENINRRGLEYRQRRSAILAAINEHCWDAELGFYTDTTIAESRTHDLPFISQHCQVFAILSGASQNADLLYRAFTSAAGQKISKCSYVMLFYAFRALSLSGAHNLNGRNTSLYEHLYPAILEPWRRMIDNHMTTWEEDDVRQRSDCHAWGSVPIYEFSSEVAGLRPLAPGWQEIEWSPRFNLAEELDATVCLGQDLTARVRWNRKTGGQATLHLSEKRRVRVRTGDLGKVDSVALDL